ncbi:HAMP domain-containing sensor histidine kinase [Nocardioides sp.]|uniref:sensor histidine kinase n=1 Tax=Nocardioides sp. TaxID=35761 RepID=UPI001A1A7D6B|nr:HAMP domain-containing sensor histidine kinase [Nocardioides sp.]MBJ7356346.1 HAMP domain-containing histidine kinase [Nocardioides sp.]
MSTPAVLPPPPDPADESKWGYRQSLASRVVLLTTFAVALAVAFVAAGAYVTVRMQLQSSMDSQLLERAKTASSEIKEISKGVDDGQAFLIGVSDVRVASVRADGVVNFLDESDRIRLGTPELEVARGETAESIRTLIFDGTRYRVVAVPAAGTPGMALVIAQSLEPQQQTLNRLGVVCLLIGLVGIVTAALVGMAVARNGLRPVRRLTSDVERIARTEDLTALPVEGDDEVARLATAFNQMLASLAASRDRQRQLVADAGHELRTPLTSLRTNIDLLTQAGEGSAMGLSDRARSELLDDVRAQIEELTTLIGDLVELARDEPMSPVVATVELHEVLEAAVARVRRRAPGVTFRLDAAPWYVEGEAGAIERALTNLLDNAAKWSPPSGTVTVSLVSGIVTIDDEGPGIDEADLPHVFERFYRSSESRAMPGSGLGLAIVAQVAERHSGTAVAGRSPSGGTRMMFALPGAPAPKPLQVPETQTV